MKMKLTEVCNITMGQSPDSSSYNQKSDGIPFFQGNADFGILYPTVRIWTTSPKKIAKKDDILISVRAPIGALNYANIECCIGRGLASITPSKKVHSKYVFYLLKSKKNNLDSQGIGSTFKAIGRKNLEEIEIENLDIEYQIKISSYLDSIQAAIDNKQQQLKELDELVKSRFIEMFGENPVESGKWNVEKWADKVNITNGKDYKKLIVKTGLYPVYGSGGDMGIRVDDYLCTENTVIIGRKGNIDKPLFVKEKFWNVDTAFGLNVNENEINPYYFFEYCKTYDFRAMDTGVTIPSLTKNALFQLKIAVPPLSLQNSFADFVQQIDKSKFVVISTKNYKFMILYE